MPYLSPIGLVASLHGTVMIGPVSPVCRAGVPCDKPAARVVLTFRRRLRVYRTKTDAKGRYSISLPPGTFAVSASVGMRISPAQVLARSGTRAQPFAIDTGIR